MIDIKFSQFFDRASVVGKMSDATAKMLKKAGAYVRTRAKSSLRTRKKTAEAGQPPSSHTKRLKDLIFFAYDAAAQSTVIGPLLFRGRRQSAGVIPLILENGGEETNEKGETKTYQKFPFLKPAIDAERPNFANIFKDSVK